MDYYDRMTKLALTFPTLTEQFPGVSPWNPAALEAAARRGACSGAIHAVKFLLNVWNSDRKWKIGQFNLMGAMGCWDARHRAALRVYLEDPFFP